MNPGTVQITDRDKVEVLRQNDLRELRHILAHLSVTAVRSSVVRTSCPLRFFPETLKPAGRDIRAGQFCEPDLLTLTLAFFDPSSSPTSLAVQPPSSAALRTTLRAWGWPLPPGRSAWPIVLSEQG